MAFYGGAPQGQAPYGQAPYGQPGQAPYGQPGQAPYGQPGGQAPYGQPGQAPYGQAPYGQPNYAQQPVDPSVMHWFQAVDTDRTGHISIMELQQALTNANWTRFNIETCRLMIGLFDRDRSGQIDLHEFQALWSYIHQWKSIFDQFDRDRSGTIDSNELHNAYMQMGYRMSPQFSQSIVFKYDTTGCHRLGLDNFIQSCVMLKSATDMFRVRDREQRGVIQITYEDFVSAVMSNKM